MCEHAGMLNHLYAKIDDLEIGEGQVVAQTAPQCFDISLWQLVSALLVGGRTLLVEQEVILDVERFVDTIVDGRVAVLQVVPSYLEVVLSYLEQHPRELPDLRCVSVTGEALKKELAQRWFAAQPGDQAGQRLRADRDLGRHQPRGHGPGAGAATGCRSVGPVNNVHVYVVDEHLSPVPLGAPGADRLLRGLRRPRLRQRPRAHPAGLPAPIRTARASGSTGAATTAAGCPTASWSSSAAATPRSRSAASGSRSARSRTPCCGCPVSATARWWSPSGPTRASTWWPSTPARGRSTVDVLRERLAASLPEYMVPSAFHWRESLPLTANSKIDRKALTALAGELDVVEEDYDAPSTPTEQRLAAAWAKVLGIPEDQIGRQDHFFDRGGTSLSAVKLAIALDRAVSLKDVTRHPVLADLAGLVDGRSEQRVRAAAVRCREPDGAPAGALVCFPYAGGNAVNFQPMARALRGSGLAVYAVELPGHDVAAEREPFAPMAQVVEQVVAEITGVAWPGCCCGATPRAPRSPWRRPGGCRSAGSTSSGCSSARSCSVTPPTGAPPSPS